MIANLNTLTGPDIGFRRGITAGGVGTILRVAHPYPTASRKGRITQPNLNPGFS
jgi:hypothetical protein